MPRRDAYTALSACSTHELPTSCLANSVCKQLLQETDKDRTYLLEIERYVEVIFLDLNQVVKTRVE